MTDDDDARRQRLGAFLRAHRERLSPEAAGLVTGRRRRTPGLRREEVADRAGISAVWYMRIEQGRDVQPSAVALVRIARVLQLGRAERAHLFDLSDRRDPEALPAPDDDVLPAGLAKAVESSLVPAYVIDRLWNARAANSGARRLLSGWLEGGEENLLRFVFRDPAARRLIVGWEERARRLLAEFRADLGRHPNDPAMLAVVSVLSTVEPLFARWWEEAHVLGRDGGLRLFEHPQDGRLAFDQITLLPADGTDFKLVLLLPAASAS